MIHFQGYSLRGCYIKICMNNKERLNAALHQICTVHNVRNWSAGCDCDEPPAFW